MQALRRLEQLHSRYQRVRAAALATDADTPRRALAVPPVTTSGGAGSLDFAEMGMVLVQLRDAIQEVSTQTWNSRTPITDPPCPAQEGRQLLAAAAAYATAHSGKRLFVGEVDVGERVRELMHQVEADV